MDIDLKIAGKVAWDKGWMLELDNPELKKIAAKYPDLPGIPRGSRSSGTDRRRLWAKLIAYVGCNHVANFRGWRHQDLRSQRGRRQDHRYRQRG